MPTNNYDKIAGVYDIISKLIYGNAIRNAQADLVKFIQTNSSVLIVGGGTGWILETIAKLQLTRVSVVYVEISKAMTELSSKRIYGNLKVDFINIGIEEFKTDQKFDFILSPFFFDNFSKEKIEIIFSKLDSYLKENGSWLYADFYFDKIKSPWWQKFLLKIMYFFFKITANIETQTLTDMRPFFSKKYSLENEAFHYHHFIQSLVWKKK